MKPGRELDALVAEKVMGLEPWPGRPGAFRAPIVPPKVESKPCDPPPYSTDIAAAWEVVGRLRSQECALHLSQSEPNDSNDGFYASFSEYRPSIENEPHTFEWARTAPEAICKAALRAVEPAVGDPFERFRSPKGP